MLLSTKENEIVNFSDKKWTQLEKYYIHLGNLDPEIQMPHLLSHLWIIFQMNI